MFDWIKKRLTWPSPVDEPYTQFVRAFIAECRRHNLVATSYDRDARSFTFPRRNGSDISVFTDNMYAEWQQRAEAGRADQSPNAAFVVSSQQCRNRSV